MNSNLLGMMVFIFLCAFIVFIIDITH
ncbi:Protein of unknown function [Bacillus cereus]|nr:Protein of unknown function [Bacillus cereus]